MRNWDAHVNSTQSVKQKHQNYQVASWKSAANKIDISSPSLKVFDPVYIWVPLHVRINF